MGTIDLAQRDVLRRRFPAWLWETLLAFALLAVILPAFKAALVQYTDGIMREASDPSFQDSINKLVSSPIDLPNRSN